MKKGVLSLLAAALLGAGLLAGCGATTESVVERMFDEKAESFSCDMDMDIDGSVGISGISVSFGVSGSMDMDVDNSDEDAPASYVKLNMKAEAMGSSRDIKTEAYTITEDDEMLVYALNPDSDEWYLSRNELEQNPVGEKSRKKIVKELKEILGEAELEKKTDKVGNETCRVLKLNTTADCLDGMLQIIWDAMDDDVKDNMEDADVNLDTIVDYLAYIEVDATIWASAKSGRMVQAELDFTGSDFSGMIKKFSRDYEELGSGMGVDISSATVNFDELHFICTFSDWDDVEVSVPKSVVNSAEDMGGI